MHDAMALIKQGQPEARKPQDVVYHVSSWRVLVVLGWKYLALRRCIVWSAGRLTNNPAGPAARVLACIRS